MSDYIPTTEMVKSLYEIGKIKAYDSYDLAEFDRWLAEVKAQAWEEGYNAKWVETYFYDDPYRRERTSE